jgi:polyisoprenoid-binding protein YceI
MELVDEVRESERREIYRVMHAEVLETSKFPEIVFDGQWRVSGNPTRDQYTVNVEGSLRLHGVTNPHNFEAKVNLGPDTFRAHGEFIMFQREFGINTASIAGSTLRLRDELKFSFFVVGRKKK